MKEEDQSGQDIGKIISDVTEKHGVDADLLRKAVQRESQFKPAATWPKGGEQ